MDMGWIPMRAIRTTDALRDEAVFDVTTLRRTLASPSAWLLPDGLCHSSSSSDDDEAAVAQGAADEAAALADGRPRRASSSHAFGVIGQGLGPTTAPHTTTTTTTHATTTTTHATITNNNAATTTTHATITNNNAATRSPASLRRHSVDVSSCRGWSDVHPTPRLRTRTSDAAPPRHPDRAVSPGDAADGPGAQPIPIPGASASHDPTLRHDPTVAYDPTAPFDPPPATPHPSPCTSLPAMGGAMPLRKPLPATGHAYAAAHGYAAQPYPPLRPPPSSSHPHERSNTVDLWRIDVGLDTRTTCMIRNIPNKYTQQMLLDFVNESHEGTYDFVYLRMDFKNRCNVGYAFIDFIEPTYIIGFANRVCGKKWSKFNSEKICSLSYANIQGRAALIEKFRNSSVMDEEPSYRPKIFYRHGPLRGQEEPFPPPDVPSAGAPTVALSSNGRDAAQTGTMSIASSQRYYSHYSTATGTTHHHHHHHHHVQNYPHTSYRHHANHPSHPSHYSLQPSVNPYSMMRYGSTAHDAKAVVASAQPSQPQTSFPPPARHVPQGLSSPPHASVSSHHGFLSSSAQALMEPLSSASKGSQLDPTALPFTTVTTMTAPATSPPRRRVDARLGPSLLPPDDTAATSRGRSAFHETPRYPAQPPPPPLHAGRSGRPTSLSTTWARRSLTGLAEPLASFRKGSHDAGSGYVAEAEAVGGGAFRGKASGRHSFSVGSLFSGGAGGGYASASTPHSRSASPHLAHGGGALETATTTATATRQRQFSSSSMVASQPTAFNGPGVLSAYGSRSGTGERPVLFPSERQAALPTYRGGSSANVHALDLFQSSSQLEAPLGCDRQDMLLGGGGGGGGEGLSGIMSTFRLQRQQRSSLPTSMYHGFMAEEQAYPSSSLTSSSTTSSQPQPHPAPPPAPPPPPAPSFPSFLNRDMAVSKPPPLFDALPATTSADVGSSGVGVGTWRYRKYSLEHDPSQHAVSASHATQQRMMATPPTPHLA